MSQYALISESICPSDKWPGEIEIIQPLPQVKICILQNIGRRDITHQERVDVGVQIALVSGEQLHELGRPI